MQDRPVARDMVGGLLAPQQAAGRVWWDVSSGKASCTVVRQWGFWVRWLGLNPCPLLPFMSIGQIPPFLLLWFLTCKIGTGIENCLDQGWAKYVVVMAAEPRFFSNNCISIHREKCSAVSLGPGGCLSFLCSSSSSHNR